MNYFTNSESFLNYEIDMIIPSLISNNEKQFVFRTKTFAASLEEANIIGRKILSSDNNVQDFLTNLRHYVGELFFIKSLNDMGISFYDFVKSKYDNLLPEDKELIIKNGLKSYPSNYLEFVVSDIDTVIYHILNKSLPDKVYLNYEIRDFVEMYFSPFVDLYIHEWIKKIPLSISEIPKDVKFFIKEVN